MIPQLLSWGGTLLSLVTTFSKDEEIKNAKDMLDTAGRAYNVLNTNSVSASAAKSIISPLVLFERELTHQEYMNDLMTIVNLRDIRDALSHINYQSVVGNINIGKLVESINPNRTAGMLALTGLEAFYPKENSIIDKKQKKEEKDNEQDKNYITSSQSFNSLTEYKPLALGRTVDAVVSYNGEKTTFPLTFRQIPMPATSEQLKLMFLAVKGGKGWSESIKEWKSGAITFPELLNGVNEIRNEFKIRTQDMTGYYEEANARISRNRTEAIRTGIISMGSLANTIILTKSTANAIELELGIRFNNPSKANKIRQAVKANTIIVVDDDEGVFTFYSTSSFIPERYTRAQIKSTSKKEDVSTLDGLIKLLNGR